MDLSEISGLSAAQEKGYEFELLDPVHGTPTGLKLLIAGPDSDITRKARQDMERELTRLSGRTGGLTPEGRERLMDGFLFSLTLGWDVQEKGKPVAFSKENFQRLLRAGTWVRAQIDTFANDRSPYFPAAKSFWEA